MASPPEAPAQPNQPQQGQQEPRQQVTVNAALDTLCAMFDQVDRDVIHMILIEGCGGNMESAVEALLTMTGGVTDQKDPNAPKKKQKAKAKPVQQQSSSSSSQKQQQQLINLPADFLRP